MQFPESWLRSFVNPSITTDELSHRLTMAGLEVEEVDPVAPPFTNIVVGHVVEVNKHPDADRLNVCKVDAGTGELLQIVCGATNVSLGIKVPCAMVGAELPPGEDGKPFKIKIGKLRGVESYGMLCSARELKLSEDHGGLLILPEDTPVGADIRKVLDLDDQIFVIKLTPNKADCLSIHGVAREVSALTGAPITVPSMAPVAVTLSDKLPVKVEAPDLCGRFSGRIIRGVNAHAKTPAWMVSRIERAGMRSVSALVDISNYVMLELGRPSHVFDLDKIHGGLTVRWGKAGEQLKLLNGTTIEVDAKVGVIADEQAVESLAGIMGGQATAVSDSTSNIYIEAAFWWPTAIAGRSRRFNFSTDAGHRFERGVDPQLTVEHLERITQLVIDICGTLQTTIGPIDDQKANMPQAEPVTLRVARAVKVIGMPLTQQRIADALRGLGLPVEEGDGVVKVTPPSFRFDLKIEEDLIEEVARMVGYNNLPTTPPKAPITAKIYAESQRSPHAVRRQLAALGYQETINFSFVDVRWETELAGNANPVALLNPIASQMSVMRSSLIGSLLQVVKFNADRKAYGVRVFEIGRVFSKNTSVSDSDTTVKGFDQPMRVAGMSFGNAAPVQWDVKDQPADFYDVKADVQALLTPAVPSFEVDTHPAMHPGRCAKVLLHGQAIGHIGELHPKWRQSWDLSSAPVMFELSLDVVIERAVPVAQAVERFPNVERDIALIVKESVAHDQVMATVHAASTQGWLRHAVLFDVYRTKTANASMAADEKSLAIRLTLNSHEATLNDAQIDQAVQAVVAQLAQQFDARLRS
jgi:phenylalanyl-tRNA synthetase beta chain